MVPVVPVVLAEKVEKPLLEANPQEATVAEADEVAMDIRLALSTTDSAQDIL